VPESIRTRFVLVLDLKEKTNFDVTAIGNSIEITLTNRESASARRHHSLRGTIRYPLLPFFLKPCSECVTCTGTDSRRQLHRQEDFHLIFRMPTSCRSSGFSAISAAITWWSIPTSRARSLETRQRPLTGIGYHFTDLLTCQDC